VNRYDKGDADRDNNTRYSQVEVINPAIGSVGRPAIKLSRVWSSPSSPVKVGEKITVGATFSNYGDGEALAPKGMTFIRVSENGKTLATGGINNGNDFIITASNLIHGVTVPLGTLPPGAHTLLVTLDPNDLIKEKDETSHTATIQINVTGPDLAMSAALQPGQMRPSFRDSLRADVVVKNLGDMKAFFPQGSTLVNYGAQGFAANRLVLPAALELAPGQEYRTTLTIPPFTVNAGSYTLQLLLDPNNLMGDPKPDNNRISLPVTLVPPTIGVTTGSSPASQNRGLAPAQQVPRQAATPTLKTTTPAIRTPASIR
jgi:hypothetical protein